MGYAPCRTAWPCRPNSRFRCECRPMLSLRHRKPHSTRCEAELSQIADKPKCDSFWNLQMPATTVTLRYFLPLKTRRPPTIACSIGCWIQKKCRAKQARQVCDLVNTDIDSATLRDLQGPFQTSLRNRSPLRPFSLSSSKSEIKKRKRRQNYRDATKQIGDDDSRVSRRHFPQFLQHHLFLKVSI